MQQLNLLTAAPAKLRITFKVDHQPETISEWWVDVVGPAPGAAAAPHLRARRDDIWAEMRRERPTRWHANGVGGLVRDREAPWIWTCSIGLELETASGLPWRIRRYAYARGAFFAVEGGNSEEWRVTVLPVARLSDLSLAGWELVLHELAEQETPTEGASI